jgi:hypothetical protein
MRRWLSALALGLLLLGAGAGLYVATKGSAGTAAAGDADGAPAVRVVEQGDGSFTRAKGAAPRVGSGRLLRYAVEVEDGIDQDPAQFADWVDRVLADPRGWTARGRWSFQRDPKGRPDFVVRLASPATVDRICAEYGLETEGEASCRGGENVVVNLRRWLLAIPAYDGDVDSYRHLVVNHEVGHFLGFGHATCPGPGERALVMQTQMYGLGGCVPNAWPYPGDR